MIRFDTILYDSDVKMTAIIRIIITPLFGYFIISCFAPRNIYGCKCCGNKYNEAEYCGLCNKNEEGNLRDSKR